MVDAEYTPHWKCGKCKKAYEDMFQAEDCCQEPKVQVQSEPKEEIKIEQEPQSEQEPVENELYQ